MLAFLWASACQGDVGEVGPTTTGSSGSAHDEPSTTHATTGGVPDQATAGSTTMEPSDDTGRTTGTDTGGPSATEGTSTGAGSSDGTIASDGTSTGSGSGEGTSSSGDASTGGTSRGPSGSGSTDTGGTDTDAGTDTGEGDTGEPSECAFTESFDGLADGSPWPAPWVESGGVMLADVQGGRGRVLPITGPYALGRMFVALPPTCVDVEATFTFEVDEAQNPGVGIYLRHNGGFLQQTDPHGQGYVAFVQAFGPATGISLWRELDGVETVLAPYTPQLVMADTVYKVRFRVTQQDPATTRLQARVWIVEGIEPAVWHVDLTDGSPSLQGVGGGGFSMDFWSQLPAGVATDVFVDDIEVGPAP